MELPAWALVLPTAARQLHNLLRDADAASEPLWQGNSLKAAVLRYETVFLPLLAAHLWKTGAIKLNEQAQLQIYDLLAHARLRLKKLYMRAKRDEHLVKHNGQYWEPFLALNASTTAASCAPHLVQPVPPIDVALCWALHRLSPRDYESDCVAMFGTTLPAADGRGLEYVSASGASEPPATVARLQWECFARAARANQRRMKRNIPKIFRTFLPSYLWPCSKTSSVREPVAKCGVVPNIVPQISYNLLAAARRQMCFLYNVSTTYYEDDEKLEVGVRRYVKFLKLMRLHPKTFVVPMYDIDLAWHAHILRDTTAYARDCEQFVGHFVNHVEDNDRSASGKQQNGYAKTVELWKQHYDEDYIDSETNYRGFPNGVRIYQGDRAYVIENDEAFRATFVNDVVCKTCESKKAHKMRHKKCRQAVSGKVQLARMGQAHGGACGALYVQGFDGSIARTSRRIGGGSCGGFDGEGGNGAGCGFDGRGAVLSNDGGFLASSAASVMSGFVGGCGGGCGGC